MARADAMKVGIVGLPNAGKSSLFNALTQGGRRGRELPVHDRRAERRDRAACRTSGSTGWPRPSAPRPVVHETIAFHDIAGLVRGAHSGEGLGNKFLANIRETDAILHVVRAHEDAQVVHPEGRVDPLARRRDDRDGAALRRPRAGRAPARARREAGEVARQGRWWPRRRWLREVVAALQEGRAGARRPAARRRARRAAQPAAAHREAGAVRGERRRGRAARAAAGAGGARRASAAPRVAVSARIESELAELDDEEAAAMRDDLGVARVGARADHQRGLRAARPDLVLHRRRGQGGARPRDPARHAARGRGGQDPHGHPARLRARRGDPWDVLVEAGGYAAAREGALRLEGRDYVMADGDVITIRFTP